MTEVRTIKPGDLIFTAVETCSECNGTGQQPSGEGDIFALACSRCGGSCTQHQHFNVAELRALLADVAENDGLLPK